MKKSLLILIALGLLGAAAHGEGRLTIAAAADLRYALDEIITAYRQHHAGAEVEVIYGSSGKITTQILNGAPFDVFFSADIAYPERLFREKFAVTEPRVYALGRIVLWSKRHEASTLTLHDLTRKDIRRIAIAQPAHAPYGLRAREALIAAGIWDEIQPKLVFGENIAHAAQMAQSEAADVGIIALSLALFPDLARHGYHLIDADLHAPLTQGYVITRYGRENPLAHDFSAFMNGDPARTIMESYGFVLPGRENRETDTP
ncbi:MAG TPA: molybdate ABC transporter substrate-binding protein [Kiritimatiellia bacterium]|nr:molybdate ABC transporter substrate-binding protein [Kiritimatiellia bacterium]HMO99953.1 molybdate ABC transporter substrate-binding protein [Kiritimatiellia bacterium]HMP97037.1 molybdate ABC transporter substrate-binding protein [Kiritimatiellia bacterium]